MDYDEKAAEKLEAVYLGRDVVAQRAHTMTLLELKPGEHVLDVGSGPGFLCEDMAVAVGPSGRVHGVDISEPLLARAEARKSAGNLSYGFADATALPDDDATYDVVVSTQVAEYVPDIAAYCAECFRMLKPGGRALIVATDWDAVTFHSNDMDRMRAVFDAFGPHCADPRLPRTLGRRLRDAGFVVDDVSGFPIINTDWSLENYSTTFLDFIRSYILGQGTMAAEVLDAWVDEQKSLAEAGAYYFQTTRVFFEAHKPI